MRTLLACFAVILAALAPCGSAEVEAPEVAIEVQANAANQATQPTEAQLVGWLELSGVLLDASEPFAWVDEGDGAPTLGSVLEQIRYVAASDRHAGLVISLDQPWLTMTQAVAIAEAIGQARDAGKQVMTFAEVYRLNGYLIACASDRVLLQKRGAVELHGLAVEEMYLAGTLEKIGLNADLVQIGRFKGANETLTRTGPSEAWDENFDALLDDLYGQVLGRIRVGRDLDKQEAERLIADAWAMDDAELIESKAVDALVDRDMLEVTEQAFGDTFEWDSDLGVAAHGGGRPSNPMALFGQLFQQPTQRTSRPTLAVINAFGPINSGESTFGDGLFSSDSIGSRTIIGALEDALLDDHIKGVVIHLDSPGGSALASEVIWQAVRELNAEKPVYAVVGSMAASGGYYIVCGSEEVYVQPTSILGSIGVVGGKITMGGLYDWMGVSVHRRTRGPNADLFNSVEPFTPEQREQVKKSMRVVYDQFRERVQIGRGNRLASIDQVDAGRLFNGKAAKDMGMADQIGGLEKATAALAERVGLSEGDYDTITLPAPMSLGEYLSVVFGVSSPQPAVTGETPALLDAARRVLGPQAWEQATRTMTGLLMLQREPTLTLLPAAIVVR